MFALSDAADSAILLRHNLQVLLGKSIPLCNYTDSASLFDVITKSSIMTEKRLMIDISTTSQSYRRNEITEVGWLKRKGTWLMLLPSSIPIRDYSSSRKTVFRNMRQNGDTSGDGRPIKQLVLAKI